MALGVLNNLSAIYAENNLNNTNSSLQTVLEQLSSGSKINSGADDAAGLSLVNGLEANQTALTQSETNATEGAGLLQVADGALSQVTSLLDRAITLATEASNGTLNSTQEGAANQEYQSILSEINNIGQTTTYNQEQVFNGQEVAIYTGDSSMAGSSVDDLNIRTLSESSLGDTGGKMAYSSGSNSVFVNMSSGTANAQASDALDGGLSGNNTMSVTYLVKGTEGSESTATTSISVGGASGFANTVGGLINAINDSGLGLTATFATQSQAGIEGGGTETGIEITGGLVSAGVDPNSASTSGTLDLSGLAANATLALGATVTVTQGANSHEFLINSSNNTLTTLAGAIGGYASLDVSASVITNGDGTQSLALSDSGPTGGALSVSTGAATTQAAIFGSGSMGSNVAVQTAGTSVNGNIYSPSSASSIIVGTTAGGELATDQLTEGTSITIQNTISNDLQTQTFVIGDGTDINSATGTHYTGNANSDGGGTTLGSLADAINAQSGTLGVYATIGSTGLTITTGTAGTGSWVAGTYAGGTPTTLTGQNVAVTQNNLTSANVGSTGTKLSLYTPTIGGQAGGGSPTITGLDTGTSGTLENDVLAGTFTLSDTQSGGPVSFVMSGTDTWQTLITDINNSSLGVSAQWNGAEGGGTKGGLELTAESNAVDPITLVNVGGGITDGGNAIVDDGSGAGVQAGAAGNVDATPSTAILQLAPGTGDMTDTGPAGTASVLGGAVNISYNGANQVFIMGSAPGSGAVGGAIYTGGTSVTSLINAINASAMGGVTNALYAKDVVASDNSIGGGTGGIYLQGQAGISSQFQLGAINTTPGTETALSVTSGVYVGGVSTTPTGSGSVAATGAVGNNAVDNITATAGTVVSTGDTMAGHITVTNSASGITDTFNVGEGADTYNTVTKVGNYYTDNTASATTGVPAPQNFGSSLQGLAAAISAESSTLGVNAQANTSGLTFTQTGTTGTYTGGNIATSLNNLTDVTEGVFSKAITNEIANENDTLSGSLVFNVGGAANGTQTVTMADVALANGSENLSEVTAEQLISFITANESTGLDLGVSAQWIPSTTPGSTFGSIELISGTQGTSGTVNVSSALTNLTDTASGAALNYTLNNAYNVGLSGGIADLTTQQTAASFTSNSKASSGTATISYTDGAGEAVNTTDLSNQTDAESALNDLNVAITDVAAQDGYIGAQINTLNSISQVMSTQQENVVSAQNAIQATDYASATSNMSKYEILSQTGIAALAQANSVEQEVTKLLQ
jgi:flagellin